MCPDCESAQLSYVWSSKHPNSLAYGCYACGYEEPGSLVTDPQEIKEILDHVNEM